MMKEQSPGVFPMPWAGAATISAENKAKILHVDGEKAIPVPSAKDLQQRVNNKGPAATTQGAMRWRGAWDTQQGGCGDTYGVPGETVGATGET